MFSRQKAREYVSTVSRAILCIKTISTSISLDEEVGVVWPAGLQECHLCGNCALAQPRGCIARVLDRLLSGHKQVSDLQVMGNHSTFEVA